MEDGAWQQLCEVVRVDEMKTWNYEINMDSEDNLFNMTSEDNWKLCKPIFSQNICVNCDSKFLMAAMSCDDLAGRS